jgi:WD40 repeat protein
VSGEVRLIAWHDGPKADVQPTVLAIQDDVFFDVAFRADGKWLAACGADGSVRVFDVSTGRERLKIANHADWVTDVCFSPDGKRIATASRDKTAKVFDAENGNLQATHSEHNAAVRAVAFAPDGKTVISAGGSRIRIWKVADSKLVGEITTFEDDIYALLARGDSVLAASADRTVRHFKLQDRTEVRTFAEHPSWVLSLAWHEASQRLATGCFDGTVTIWNLQNGARLNQFLAVPTGASTQH